MTNLQRALIRWNEQRVRLLPPPDRAAVIQALTRTGRRFANDVVEFYCITGGFDDQMDNRLFSLWPLRHLEIRNAGSDATDLAFADFLIDSFLYYFRYETESRSSVHGGYESQKLADSIDEFFGLYLTAPEKLDLF